jgi:hypothetical protein
MRLHRLHRIMPLTAADRIVGKEEVMNRLILSLPLVLIFGLGLACSGEVSDSQISAATTQAVDNANQQTAASADLPGAGCPHARGMGGGCPHMQGPGGCPHMQQAASAAPPAPAAKEGPCPCTKDGKCECGKHEGGQCPCMKDGKCECGKHEGGQCPCMKDGKCACGKDGKPCQPAASEQK